MTDDYAVTLYIKPPSDDDQRKFWIEQFKNQALTPRDTLSDRIQVCYRLTRMLAYWKGIVTSDQTLAEGTDIHPDPWYNETTVLANRAPAARRTYMIQVQRWPMSLQPPPIPNKPGKDRRLIRWLQLISRIVRQLNLVATDEGRRGLKWLLEPETVREMWIKPEILMAYESILLGEFLDEQLDKGVYEGQLVLRRKYGFTKLEMQTFGDLSRTAAPDIITDALETKKAMMELRIDKFMQRARQEGDMRAELQGLKLLAIIQGLNKIEPDDDLKGMVQIVAEISEKTEKKENHDEPS
jgi:hypothetical protein